MAKYHGTNVRSERKPRRRTSGETLSSKQTSSEKKIDHSERAFSNSSIKQSSVQISNKPLYNDPSANSKLEMIKNIRSQRKAVESEIAEAIEQARSV